MNEFQEHSAIFETTALKDKKGEDVSRSTVAAMLIDFLTEGGVRPPRLTTATS